MSSKTKENDIKQKTLQNKKAKGKNPLAALTEVLELSSNENYHLYQYVFRGKHR